MLARGTPPWILLPFLLEGLLAGAFALAPFSYLLLLPATAVLTFLGVGLLLFFRDPPRRIGPDVVSPADGVVLRTDPDARSLAIFMNVHNVHVNRAPLGGLVEEMKYSPGTHANARRDESQENERLRTRLRTALGEVLLTQYSGAVARRIVPYVRRGDRVRKGQRIGLIRLGSRVEIVLPEACVLAVRVGDRVLAGETTIARVVR